MKLPQRGFILGLEAQYSAAGSAGTFEVNVAVTGPSGAYNALDTGAVNPSTLPVLGSGFSAAVNRTITSALVDTDDYWNCQVHTNGTFAATGGDLIVDVFVGLGDGL